ncbi:hypothetical protein GCM10019016_102260 [Streptomyces prasinosporus]|uniref:Uncharacterized protein n=1 Tax=Streptomyces prasinosporus TaxID=68256 RepID=A0ABP6U9G9_9ACTN
MIVLPSAERGDASAPTEAGRTSTRAVPEAPGTTETASTDWCRSTRVSPSTSTRSRVGPDPGAAGGRAGASVRTRERQVRSQGWVTPSGECRRGDGELSGGIRSAPSTTPSRSSTSRSIRRSAPSSTARAAATAPHGTPSARASDTEPPTGTRDSAHPASSRRRCSSSTARTSARSSPTTTGRREPRRASARANSSGPSGRHTFAPAAPARSTSRAIRTDSPSARRATGSMTTRS